MAAREQGRIIVRGKTVKRGEAKKADYILSYKPNLPLAVLEAKDNNHTVGAGMQQALEYAEILDVPFAYSSNGAAFLEHDRTAKSGAVSREIPLDQFPTPSELWARYCTAQLDHFIDPESTYPVIACTSRLMSTGVDAQTCHLIVLDRRIASMTEFKQIIGRGTRINEDYNKLFFTIMDFKRATALFADPDFDGDPVQIYEPNEGETVVPPDESTEGGEEEPPRGSIGEPLGGEETLGTRPIKYYVNNVEVRVATERVQYLDEQGKLITESLKDYSRKTLRQSYASLEAFLTVWNDAEKKQAILDELAAKGVFFEELAEQVGRDYDAFDLVCHVAFDAPPLTREERADNVKSATSSASMATKPARSSIPCFRNTLTAASPAWSRWRFSKWTRSPPTARPWKSSNSSVVATATSPPSANLKLLSINKLPEPCPTSLTSSKPSKTLCARTPAPTAMPSASNSSVGCSS